MLGAIRPLPQYVFMTRYLVRHKDNFTFTFAEISIPVCTDWMCLCGYTCTLHREAAFWNFR